MICMHPRRHVLIMEQLIEECREIKGWQFNQGCTRSKFGSRHKGLAQLEACKASQICKKKELVVEKVRGGDLSFIVLLTAPVGALCSSEHFRFQQAWNITCITTCHILQPPDF